MTKKLIWRLKEQPSPESLRELVNDGLLTKDEAREILFSSKTEEDRDKESLKSEIKFLRELVEKLSSGRTQIIETIREVERPWKRYPWYDRYIVWCQNTATSGTLNLSATTTDSSDTVSIYNSSFSDIKTF